MPMRPAPVGLLVFFLLVAFWLAVTSMAAPAGAQTVFSGCMTTTPVGGQSLYVGCVTLTPSATHSPTYTATASLPPTLTPRPTMTTVRLASPTPSPTLRWYVTPYQTPPTDLPPIFIVATQRAWNMTMTPGHNDSTAIVETANAYNTMAASPTPDEFTPMPTLSPTPTGARYQVVAVAGMNVRSQPTTGSSTIGYLRYGDIVYIGEHRRVGNIVWGAVLGPNIQWVAIVYDTTPNKSGDETIYLRAVGAGS